MKKKIFSALTLTMGLSLTACSGGASSAPTTAAGSAPAQEAAPAAGSEKSEGGAEAQEGGELVLGFAVPLTGTSAAGGEIVRNGVQMAVDEINEAVGIDG